MSTIIPCLGELPIYGMKTKKTNPLFDQTFKPVGMPKHTAFLIK